jgi:hypothetical protein
LSTSFRFRVFLAATFDAGTDFWLVFCLTDIFRSTKTQFFNTFNATYLTVYNFGKPKPTS